MKVKKQNIFAVHMALIASMHFIVNYTFRSWNAVFGIQY